MINWGVEHLLAIVDQEFSREYAYPKWMDEVDASELLCYALYWFEQALSTKISEAYYWIGESCNVYDYCNQGAGSYASIFWDNAKKNVRIKEIVKNNPNSIISRILSGKDVCYFLGREYLAKSAEMGIRQHSMC